MENCDIRYVGLGNFEGKWGLRTFAVNGDMFGRYVKIPHVLAEDGGKFIFKVVGRLQSNAYCNVPIGGVNGQIEIHEEIIDVLHVIQCGIDETEVLTVALKDCELVEPRTNAEKINGMSVEELAEFLVRVRDAYYMPCKWVREKCRNIEYIDSGSGCSDCFREWLERECDAEC